MTDLESNSIRKAYHPAIVILVVEDHMMFWRDIKHAAPQHQVIFARTMEEARARYEEHMPDMTFLDIDLPDGNGLELIDYIRGREPEAFIVVLTGSKLHEDVAAAQRKGAHGYIIKPFTQSRIEQTIEKYLGIREKRIQSLLVETEKHRLDSQEHHDDRT